ncbi:hypothetical protein IMSAGC009_02989 [Lachnospiraceae bacterium]|nr:hypothetical protein IMSAGC009_02989 [Lachnospiraceae bacterium]
MDYQTFKKNIEHLTGETKQNKIADILHVSTSKISKWFTGELLPTFTDILNISETYHCSIDWLIGNENKDKQKLSMYDICKFLVKLDNEYFINIELRNVVEEISFLDTTDEPTKLNQKYKKLLPVIYIHESLSAEDMEHLYEIYNYHERRSDFKDFEEDHRMFSTALPDNKWINNFLIKYAQLKEALCKRLLPKHIFDDVVNGYLREISEVQKVSDFIPVCKNINPPLLNKYTTLEPSTNELLEKRFNDALNYFSEDYNAEFLDEDKNIANEI